MNAIRVSTRSVSALALLLVLTVATFSGNVGYDAAAQQATPSAGYSCDDFLPSATPDFGHGHMPGVDMGTPTGDMRMDAGFDIRYIDMMIPHHESIIALAEAALPRLSDSRLQRMAEAIITAQSAEQDELRGFRAQWFGNAESMPMDHAMMKMMPGIASSMDDMAIQMDPHAQVALFCDAGDPDLAFIELTIPHHQSAIAASEAAIEMATHEELRVFARRVIEDQQREINELTMIRGELTGAATPVP